MRLDVLANDRWADAVAADLADVLGRPHGARVCLPTGGTPVPVYERVPAFLRRAGRNAGESTIVLLDEYVGLDPDDPARCAAQLRRQLVDRLDPAPAFEAIDVDRGSPVEAAAALDASAARLHLAVVGLGLNGHVGMNEPGSAADAPTRVVELAPPTARVAVEMYGARRAPAKGITVGIDRLLAAGELWLIVAGAAKADILRAVLEEPVDDARPASHLRSHAHLRVIADASAAAALARGSDGLGDPEPRTA